MQEELDASEAVSRAIDRVKRVGRFAELELSNGIVLTLKPIAPFMITALSKEFEPPPPPKVFLEEKGREEENPNDPAYIRELERLNEASNLAMNDLVLALGTAVKSIPEGYFPPEDDSWIEQVEYAFSVVGQDIKIEREDKIRRYLHWLRFYALETLVDTSMATSLYWSLVGIAEGEVAEALDSFRNIPKRGADSVSAPAETSENGNSTNRATRRASARSRGT